MISLKIGIWVSLLPFMITCGASKEIAVANQNTQETQLTVNGGTCPEEGECSFKVIEDASFTLAKDESNRLYPALIQGDGRIAEFRYEEKGPEGSSDGDYLEVIQFNIPEAKGGTYENEALREVGLLYYKQCFCKAEAGYYEVTQGNLKVTTDPQGNMEFELQFSLSAVSHTVRSIAIR